MSSAPIGVSIISCLPVIGLIILRSRLLKSLAVLELNRIKMILLLAIFWQLQNMLLRALMPVAAMSEHLVLKRCLVATLLCICLWNYMLTKVYKWPVHIEGLNAKVLLNKETDRAPLNSPFYMHVQEYIHCRCLNIFNNVCIWEIIILDCKNVVFECVLFKVAHP